jgi:DNA repair photolyase
MIRLHHNGELLEFADGDAIIAHFSLTTLHADTLAGIRAASDAGFPLHACVDPFIAEIRDRNVLMLDNDADDLRAAYRERREDI